MKVKDYKKFFDQLDTTKEIDDKILNAAKQSASDQKAIRSPHRFSKRMVIAIAALCVVIVTATVGATITSDYFAEMFGKEISQYSEEAIFVEENEHGIMTVEQVITDRINTYLVFSYEMLDERCREWMDNYFLKDGLYLTDLNPVHTKENGGVWGHRVYTAKEAGLEQYETENKKYFMIDLCTCSYRCGGTDKFEFEYLVPGRGAIHKTELKITEEIPSVVYDITPTIDSDKPYNIKPKKNNDKLYEPKKVTLSSFGICIEGKYLGDKDNFNKEDSEKQDVDSLFLVTKDGHWIDLLNFDNLNGGGASGLYTDQQSDDEIDYVIKTCSFKENINVEDIVGVRIDQIYYEFNK